MNIVSTLIGAVLQIFLLGGIASGLMSLMLVQGSTQALSEVTSQATSAEAALRSDASWALSVHPGGLDGSRPAPEAVAFVLDPADEAPDDVMCSESTWALDEEAVSGRTQVVNTLVHYTGRQTAPDGTTQCSGNALNPITQVFIRDAGEARFSYENPAGRVFNDDGTLETSEPRAPGVLPVVWQSPAVASIRLDTGVGMSTDYARENVVVEQRLQNLRMPPGDLVGTNAAHSTDVGSVFLGTGSLRPAT